MDEEETMEEWYARVYPRYARERALHDEYVKNVGGYANFSFPESLQYIATRLEQQDDV
jgi:hypothetical protein